MLVFNQPSNINGSLILEKLLSVYFWQGQKKVDSLPTPVSPLCQWPWIYIMNWMDHYYESDHYHISICPSHSPHRHHTERAEQKHTQVQNQEHQESATVEEGKPPSFILTIWTQNSFLFFSLEQIRIKLLMACTSLRKIHHSTNLTVLKKEIFNFQIYLV